MVEQGSPLQEEVKILKISSCIRPTGECTAKRTEQERSQKYLPPDGTFRLVCQLTLLSSHHAFSFIEKRAISTTLTVRTIIDCLFPISCIPILSNPVACTEFCLLHMGKFVIWHISFVSSHNNLLHFAPALPSWNQIHPHLDGPM